MNKRYKPHDVPTLSPYLTVRDADQAIEFYQNAFGFKLKEAPKGKNGKIQHVEMTFDDAFIMFAPEGAWEGKSKAPKTLNIQIPVTFYLYCPDVDALYAQAIKAGAQSAMEPQDSFWGDRMCSVIDPDGYAWSFATFSGERK